MLVAQGEGLLAAQVNGFGVKVHQLWLWGASSLCMHNGSASQLASLYTNIVVH